MEGNVPMGRACVIVKRVGDVRRRIIFRKVQERERALERERSRERERSGSYSHPNGIKERRGLDRVR